MKIKEIRLERITESNSTVTVLSPFDPNYNVLPELNGSQRLMIGYMISFIFGTPQSSADIYEESEALYFVDSKVSIVFHQFDGSLMPPSLRNSPELTVTRVMIAGRHDRYFVNGLEVQSTLIEELRHLFHLGPVKHITPGRIVEVMRISADQRLRIVEEAAGLGSIKKDIASERQHLVQMKTDWSHIKASLLAIERKREPMKEQRDIFDKWKAEVQRLKRLRIAYDYDQLLDEEKKLIETLSGQEDESRLKKHAEEIGVAEEDAKCKLIEEQTRVDRLQETLDALSAEVSNEIDTGWARATKFLKGESFEKIATTVCLEYTSDGFHVTISEYKENKKDMEKLKLSLSDFQNNCDVIQEKSRGVDHDLKDLGVRMNNWKDSIKSLSLIVRDIKKKFPKLDPDPNKAQATQIATCGKLKRFWNEKSTLFMDIVALKDRYIEELETETNLSMSVNGKEHSNEVVVMTDIGEIHARAIKEELNLIVELKKIEGVSSACEQRLGVLEKKLLTSIGQFQDHVIPNTTLQAENSGTVMVSSQLDGNPNQPSITFLDMVDATLDATDINLMKNALINKFPNHQFSLISGK
ncbi:hypothetical protein Tco_0575620 [Tanacetum coccineum]